MSILELRGEIKTIVSKVEDEVILSQLRDLLIEALGGLTEEQENLSNEQLVRLEYLKHRARESSHQVPDEMVWDLLKRRRMS